MNSAARPSDRLAATRPQLKDLEIDDCNSLKATLPSLQSTKVQREPILKTDEGENSFSALPAE